MTSQRQETVRARIFVRRARFPLCRMFTAERRVAARAALGLGLATQGSSVTMRHDRWSNFIHTLLNIVTGTPPPSNLTAMGGPQDAAPPACWPSAPGWRWSPAPRPPVGVVGAADPSRPPPPRSPRLPGGRPGPTRGSACHGRRGLPLGDGLTAASRSWRTSSFSEPPRCLAYAHSWPSGTPRRVGLEVDHHGCSGVAQR